MKRYTLIPLLSICVSSLTASTLILEDYESLNPGDSEPNFQGIGSNFPEAVIQVEAEDAGLELFRSGNTRFLDWESLSGINPDDAGFLGGPSTFNAFPEGPAEVVSIGFDFILEKNHAELLFGVGEPQTNRSDDQNYGVRIVIRGNLGIHGKPEIVTTFPADAGDQGLKNGVPYRVEVVANQSGEPISYMSPIGPMTVGNERYDLFLRNLETDVYQLVFDESEWHNSPMTLEGFWWATYPYTSTGRAVDIKLDNIAVYENEIVLTGFEDVRPQPTSAYINFENLRLGTSQPESLWYLPGTLVEEPDTGKTFGDNNRFYYDTNGASLPDSWTDEFRFKEDLDLLSMSFDVQVDRNEVISTYDDGHDEVFLAFSGGDTRANAAFTSIVKIRGTRSIGNEGSPADAEPTLVITGKTSANRGFGFDWSKPYRIQVLFNQSGGTVTYDTPWGNDTSLGHEMVQLYLYNYETGENVQGDGGTPYYIEAPFLNGLANAEGVKGTLYNCFWKTVTGRKIDLRLDNIAILENEIAVTDPGAFQESQITFLDLTASSVPTPAIQTESIYSIGIEFSSVPGSSYSLLSSQDMKEFKDLNTFIPSAISGDSTQVEIPLTGSTRFIVIQPIQR